MEISMIGRWELLQEVYELGVVSPLYSFQLGFVVMHLLLVALIFFGDLLHGVIGLKHDFI